MAKHAIGAGDKSLISGLDNLTKVYKCKEAGCLAVFHYKEGLDGHLVNDHGREDLKWSCKLCGAKYTHKRHHDRHMREKHRKDRDGNDMTSIEAKFVPKISKNSKNSGKCKICGFKFDSKYDLDAHLVQVHEHDPKWKCQECDSKFILKRDSFINHKI